MGLVKPLGIGFLDLKSPLVKFPADGYKQDKGDGEVESGSGLGTRRRPHSSETGGRLVSLGIF